VRWLGGVGWGWGGGGGGAGSALCAHALRALHDRAFFQTPKHQYVVVLYIEVKSIIPIAYIFMNFHSSN
jgi:hypothetical protein